ncbi:uridylate kinase [Candidatus Rickettsiella viridis]|uniref:Uridylate kinase n=1 Tax=Candidatus Rickettsiella viridis TaxID=676208 RepID=A0A2Z5UUV6_9COXI|nr:UMP kinase [Candidatus Rickettsiella viridis]BBB15349.1 uridylate kinase [Candidatus Rickettsiella viridis]
MTSHPLKYRRILLKLSGEALNGKTSQALDPTILHAIVDEIIEVANLGVQIGIVIGGGNLFRGAALEQIGIDRITGDQMGMLATFINALALRDSFEQRGKVAKIMSAISTGSLATLFERHKAKRYLEKGYIVIFAGGTGNPLVSTDSAASLRGIEINADVLLKATHVDGIFSADPKKDKNATLYSHISYQKVLEEELGIMDLAAFSQCRDYNLPIHVFNIQSKNTLRDIIQGKKKGTLVSKGE